MTNKTLFPPPAYVPAARALVALFGRLYLRFALGVSKIELPGREVLQSELKRFKEGRTSLIIAFRHTAVEDAPTLLLGVKNPHLRFLYGRDVVNWAGKPTKLLFPALGFVAVENRGNNRESARYLHTEVQDPRFPIALAPEGQVSYHAYSCASIEPGAAHLASWALEGPREEVVILPVGIGYRYAKDEERFLSGLITRWEKESGIPVDRSLPSDGQIRFIGSETLKLVNTFWNLDLTLEGSFIEQRDRLCDSLLAYSESLGGIEDTSGSIIDRLFRVRYRAVGVLNDTDRSSLSEEERKLHDREVERQRISNHASQVVDVLEYLDLDYLEGKHTVQRSIEVLLSLLDVLNRLQGGMINSRFSPKGKKAFILGGTPIEVRKTFGHLTGRKKRLNAITRTLEQRLDEVSLSLEEVMLQSR
ncbi:MAG: hypothetical protein GX911_03265 [Spirochaetales bacterium]|nr:hypothetical protein [Spirochaetales bacterium]